MTKVKQTWHLLHICCPRNYWVKAVFTVFTLLVNVIQTQNLTYVQIWSKLQETWYLIYICHPCKSIFWVSKYLTSLPNYCRSKFVSNVYFLFTFATLRKYRINAVFTIFAFPCKCSANRNFEFDQIWSNLIIYGIYFIFAAILLSL